MDVCIQKIIALNSKIRQYYYTSCLIIVAEPNTSNKEILKSYNVVYKVVAKTINGLQQNLLNNAFKHIMCFSSSIMQECIVLLYL